MSLQNALESLSERVDENLLPEDQSGTGSGWHAFLQRARHSERMRIARELHDTLFQGFLGASMQLCLVDDWLPADSPAKPVLRRALELMRKGLEEGRSALRGLRSSALPDGSLEKALSDVYDDFAAGRTSRLSVVILGRTRPIAPAVHEQIYWIAREGLLNALRHSAARHIKIEIRYLPRKLHVVVRDDGGGIDPKTLRTAHTSHWGLRGMQERAASIGAKLRVSSKPGKGTEVEISLPTQGEGKKV